MSGSRTEQPTAKRLRDARERGDVAVSRELTSAAALGAGLLALVASGPAICAGLAASLRHALAGSGADDIAPGAALVAAALQLASAAAIPLCAATVGALACGALQAQALFTWKAVAPRWDRVAPLEGFRRLFSASQLALLALGLLKIASVAALAWSVREELAGRAAALLGVTSPATLLAAAPATVAPLAFRVCLLLVAFGALDLLLARRRHTRSLRMSLEEIRREQKEQDGDPQHKADRQRAHRALAGAPPAARATCVIVNPSHIAVALRHDPASDTAPVVLAKGSGEQARRIRVDALRAAVPIVKDVPLARALFRLAEVGDEIPEELYHAAAAVLVHVHGLAEDARS